MFTSIKVGTGLQEAVPPYKEVNFFNVSSAPNVDILNTYDFPPEIVGEFSEIDMSDIPPGRWNGVVLVTLKHITEPGELTVYLYNKDSTMAYDYSTFIPNPADEDYEYWNYWWVYMPIFAWQKNDKFTAEVYWNGQQIRKNTFIVTYNPSTEPGTEPATGPEAATSFPWLPVAILLALALWGIKK
jgi:hypothetical protein